MSEETKTLEFSGEIPAPPEQVYDALTNRLGLQAWFANFAASNPQENGRFYAWWNEGYYTSGVYTKLKQNEQVAYTWQGRGEPRVSKVEISLAGQNGGTQVSIRHSELGVDGIWEETVKGLAEGWESALENLHFLFEKGINKRFYDLPFLGVLLDSPVTDEYAKEMGLPKRAGVSLTGTVEGTGAARLDLENEDVLYALGGVTLKNFSDFRIALQGKKAGDKIDMVYYRAGEEVKTQLELSRRPFPEVPVDPEDLAKILEEQYSELDKELDAVFEGASEDEASKRPGEKEWSAKEVVAHLLISEQSSYMFISAMIGGRRPGGFTNDLGMHTAVAYNYPSVADIVEELKRAERITVQTIKLLPKDFVANKGKYTGLGQRLLTAFGTHQRGHFEQMKAALEAARA